MKPARLSLRLALLGGTWGTLLVCALVAFFYIALTRQLDNQTQSHLRDKFEQVLHTISEEPSGESIRANSHRLSEFLIGHEDLHIALSKFDSRDLIGSFGDAAQESSERIIRTPEEHYSEWRLNGARYLSVASEGQTRNGDRLFVIVTSGRLNDDRLQAYFLGLSLFILPVALALVVAGAWWITQSGLRPLSRLRQAAASVTTHDLSYRLATDDLPIELRELAISFNKMLERLEDGVSRLAQFSGDLAHEMRTPISNILGKTQVTLSKERSADDYRTVLESNVEEFVRLGSLVNDMLFLTQVERAEAALNLEPLDLRQEAARAAEFFETIMEDNGIRIHIEGHGVVDADRLMVQRAVLNLISNAIRHTPKGAEIFVQIDQLGDSTAITVSNPGEHIPTKHLPNLFERFYRVDPSRSRAQGGTGLGLAIVKSIMKLHGGDVTVESEAGRMTSFCLSFPKHAKLMNSAAPASQS